MFRYTIKCILVLIFTYTPASLACSLMPDHSTPTEFAKKLLEGSGKVVAKIKIVGKEEVKHKSGQTLIKYTLKVLKQYKGDKTSKITGYTSESSSCGYFHEIGYTEIISLETNDFYKLQFIKGDFAVEFPIEKLEAALDELTKR